MSHNPQLLVTLLLVTLVVVLTAVYVWDRKRRARMTPGETAADDEANRNDRFFW